MLVLAAFAPGLFAACAPLEQTPSIAEQRPPISLDEKKPTRNKTLPSTQPAAEVKTDSYPYSETWAEVLPKATVESEDEAEGEDLYDFPVTMNEQVEYYLDLFQNRQRKNFTRWLARSSRYLPMIKKELAEAGLPMDLAYLPMIESGFNPIITSRASAVGTWQFMRATGLNYGLTVNEYVDERRDPIKSTKAAVAYLANLYKKFDSWHLAVAAYNAGEGRISRAMKQSDSDDFWEIAQSQYIHSETKLYVPQLIAAIMIAKEPEKYGFNDIDYDLPIEFETIEVPRRTSLEAVALACESSVDELTDLNRHLCRAVTPPQESNYPLRVPKGKKELVAENLPRVKTVVSTEYRTHRVEKGETLTKISRKYNLSKTTLLKANNLQKERLTRGQHLRIPYQTTSYKLLSKTELAKYRDTSPTSTEGSGKPIRHTVRTGETIGSIAKRYDVQVDMIAAWNKLKDPSRIKVGQKLRIHAQQALSAPSQAEFSPTKAEKTITAQNKKTVKANGTSGKKETQTFYMVKAGDTLWSIAQKYQLSPQDIRNWNKLASDNIQPGNRLLLNLGT